MKKVLITGANGYIGGYLRNVLKELYHIIATDIHPALSTYVDTLYNRKGGVYDVGIKDYLSCDLLNRSHVYSLINKTLPDVIVHCAGTKDLFGCEKDPYNAYRINVETTKNLIDNINGSHTRFIFLSSDYVFSGDKGGYCEEDVPSPKTVYGKNKLECEGYIKGLASYIICRTASVYGWGSKFFDFILDSLKNSKAIDMYNDAYFSPTYIGNLIDIIGILINKDISGILHTAGPERISRYDFALKIAKGFNLNTRLIQSVPKPNDSPIANDSSLDVSLSSKKIGIPFAGIDEGLGYIKGQRCIL